jgi:hypothetical protein
MMDPQNKLKLEELKRQQKEQQIQRMEQDKRELLLAKELEELRRPPPAAKPPKKATTLGQSEKQKLLARAYTRRDREIERIEAMKRVRVILFVPKVSSLSHWS